VQTEVCCGSFVEKKQKEVIRLQTDQTDLTEQADLPIYGEEVEIDR
jgi:hypothetical protein